MLVVDSTQNTRFLESMSPETSVCENLFHPLGLPSQLLIPVIVLKDHRVVDSIDSCVPHGRLFSARLEVHPAHHQCILCNTIVVRGIIECPKTYPIRVVPLVDRDRLPELLCHVFCVPVAIIIFFFQD